MTKGKMEQKTSLLGMTIAELRTVAAEVGLPAYAASQMADWLYKKRVSEVAEMTNIALRKREVLAAGYTVGAREPAEAAQSKDGTVKYLFEAAAGRFVEAVYIPAEERDTLCVSSQVGCRMACHFCMTGRQGLGANLTAGEIMNQILRLPEATQLTNLVFMGMGEPLDNVDEVLKALEILTSSYGVGWSPRRITVSTVGVAAPLRRFLAESECHLAVSLHSPFAEERARLMPAERACPVEEVVALLKEYDFAHRRRGAVEYILFDGVNDTMRHVKALAALLRGLPCRVNLIRFHAIPGVALRSCSAEKMIWFRDALNARGVVCTIRTSRGEDIQAACGMLSTKRLLEKRH